MTKGQRLPLDRISELPSNIIDLILIRLPILEAVRTSIFSRKWRNSWAKIPALVFDDRLFKGSTTNQLSKKSVVFHTIYQVLLLHDGPILEFTLTISELESSYEIDRIIVFLMRKSNLEKFVLRIGKGDDYKLRSSFFSCRQLVHLDIQACVFEPPLTFKGFSRLTSLSLIDVVISSVELERLISNCPLLESLTLVADDKHFVGGGKPNFIKFFSHLSRIQRLHMNYYPIKSLAAGGVPKKLETPLINLRRLEFSELCFKELDELAFALGMIRSSPNLEKLDISMHFRKEAVPVVSVSSYNAQDYSDIHLDKLKEVWLEDIRDLLPELEFIKFLLGKSPMLEKAVLIPYQKVAADEKVRMLKDLIRFPRASPVAEIIFI